MNKKLKNKNEENDKNSEKNSVKANKQSAVKYSLKMKLSAAIIAFVFLIIITITGYFIWRESNLLKTQVFNFIKREIVHLSNTAQESIGIDELALINSIQGLKKISYLKYSFILNVKNPLRENVPSNRENIIIQYFDLRGKKEIGGVLNDNVDRKQDDGTKIDEIKIVAYPDPGDPKGIIYDFSRAVLNKVDNKKIATVVIGFSDIIIRNERANLIKAIGTISLAILAISIVGSILLTGILIRPIKKLSHGASVIGQGNFDHKIEINTKDELGQLANEFNEMTALIKNAKDKEIESRLMEEQLEMAKDIQEGLNPMGYYNTNGIQIKGFTRAAKGVGGDYFDYLDIDENRVCALISDVSGKGVPASLVMVMIRTVFTSYITRTDIDCARVVRAINDSLSADFAIDKFATLFFMIYDRSTQELSFSNAGHGPLFCYRSDLGECTNTTLDGVPIGIMEDVDYKQAKVKMNPGDIIIMYTDGVTEMRNAAKEEYGIKKVQDLLLNKNNLSAEEIVKLLVDDVDDFRGDVPPHDDETLLVFKIEK